MRKNLLVFLCIVFVVMNFMIGCYSRSREDVAIRVNKYLAEAKISEGTKELSRDLSVDPNDDLRFGLGVLQFLGSIEKMGQSWYRYGLRVHDGFVNMIPFLRLPVPRNPEPESISNSDVRRILNTLVNDLAASEKTLSGIKSDSVTLSLFFGRAYFDFDGNGQASDQEALWRIYGQLNPRAEITEQQANDFVVKLDAGDVKWLQAYCHLLSGLLEWYLAYDDSRLFERTAHLFFEKPKISYDFLMQRKSEQYDYSHFIDAIALIHLLDLPVKDPERAGKAIEHFRKVTELSRQSWEHYMAETGDDREWIPNPSQEGVIPGVKVTEEMVQQWLAFLDEIDDLFAGKKLIPFWRGNEPLGVNLKRVFTEPKELSLVLWVQGTAAAPYLERGVLTEPEFWNRLMRTFDGRFAGFAFWFN